MTTTQLNTITVNGSRQLAWSEYGDPDGAATIFFHGTPGGRLSVTHQSDFLPLRLRVVVPDRAGYGHSDPLPGRSVLDSVEDSLAILDACGFEEVLAVGGSGGGPHALALAASAPDRVRAVGVFVGAAPLVAEEISNQTSVNQSIMNLIDKPGELRELLGQIRTSILGTGLSTVLADMPASDRAKWAQDVEFRQKAADDALAPGVQGMYDDYRAIFHDEWGFEPSDIAVPVVWAHGDEDRNMPISAAWRVTDSLPHCRVIRWVGVGHAPGPEQMTEFYAALVACTTNQG